MWYNNFVIAVVAVNAADARQTDAAKRKKDKRRDPMKRVLTLLLVLAMLFSMFAFVACNGDAPGTPDEPSQPDTPVTPDEPEEPEEPEVSEDQKEADKVIERIKKITEITADTWRENENKIEYARKYYDKLTDAQKALIDAELVEKLETAEIAYAAFLAASEKAEALTVNKIVEATPLVDGLLEGYYVMGTTLELDDSVTVRFAYDKDYLYIYAENLKSRDDITLKLACNAQLAAGVVLSTSGVKTFADDAASAATADYPYQAVETENGFIAEVALTLEDLGLEDDDLEDEAVGVTFACGSANYVGFDSLEDCERFFTAESSNYNYIATGTPVIDGEMDELYLDAHAITLSQDVVNAFTPAEKNQGGGWYGDTSLTDSDIMSNTFRFAVDDQYLYIIEHRIDLNPVYGATSLLQPFRGDGSLLWFSKDGDLGAGIQWNRAIADYDGPCFGLFFDDAQSGGLRKNWEFAVKQYGTDFEYIMELKVPLVDLELTREDFEQALVGFTFCSADIVNPDYNAASFDWNGTGYQMNYVGVNTWRDGNPAKLAVLLPNASGDAMSVMPELTGEYAPEYAHEYDVWDASSGIEQKPFDTFPTDETTGYLATEWQKNQLDAWFELEYENKVLFNFNRDALPTMADGVELLTVNNPSRNSTVGYFCDALGSYAGVSVDLTKYKDAMVTISTGQNYVLEVSTDGESWTELYNYITVKGTPTKDTQTFYGYAIDSTVYAADADTLYVRVGQAKTTETGWGGVLQGVTVFYR